MDKDEFRSYAKKYSLAKIPPFVVSQHGSKPELFVQRPGAKIERTKSLEEKPRGMIKKKSLGEGI